MGYSDPVHARKIDSPVTHNFPVRCGALFNPQISQITIEVAKSVVFNPPEADKFPAVCCVKIEIIIS